MSGPTSMFVALATASAVNVAQAQPAIDPNMLPAIKMNVNAMKAGYAQLKDHAADLRAKTPCTYFVSTLEERKGIEESISGLAGNDTAFKQLLVDTGAETKKQEAITAIEARGCPVPQKLKPPAAGG